MSLLTSFARYFPWLVRSNQCAHLIAVEWLDQTILFISKLSASASFIRCSLYHSLCETDSKSGIMIMRMVCFDAGEWELTIQTDPKILRFGVSTFNRVSLGHLPSPPKDPRRSGRGLVTASDVQAASGVAFHRSTLSIAIALSLAQSPSKCVTDEI